MRITKLHHACVTITDGTSALLFDPGEFAPAPVEGVDAVCVTHLHRDHLDPSIITTALAHGIPVWLPRDAADLLEPHLLLHVAEPGDEFAVGALRVRVCGNRHAEVHPELLGPLNRGYLVNESVLVTGDEHVVPPAPVRTLVTPIDAPWLRATDLMRYVRQVRPRLVLGVHDGLLNHNGRTVAQSVAASLEREGACHARVLTDGEVLEIGLK